MRRGRVAQPVDNSVWRATRLFVDGRLKDPDILAWAAKLGPDALAQRRAIRDAVFSRSQDLAEPYVSAWRCVLEAWRDGVVEDPDMTILEINEAIGRGSDPRLYLSSIVGLASPRLKVTARGPLEQRRRRGPPKIVQHLLSVRMEADHHVKLEDVGLADCGNATVWDELLDRTEGAFFAALHFSDRLGLHWATNWVARVYPAGEPGDDPDEFRSGFVPIVRLYSAALARLIATDPGRATQRLEALATRQWPLTRRIWAAAARNAAVVNANAVSAWLKSQTDDDLWDVHVFPEFAELRAARFAEVPPEERDLFERRVRRGPPANTYRRGVPKARRKSLVEQASVSELQRLQAGGARLAAASRAWLNTRTETVELSRAGTLYERESFLPSSSGLDIDLEDPNLIASLDERLTDKPYVEGRSALETITAQWNAIAQVLQTDTRLLRFGRVVGALASAQRDLLSVTNPTPQDLANARAQTESLLGLLAQVPSQARSNAAPGVAYWFDGALARLPDDERLAPLWLAYWPAAAEATNAEHQAESASSAFEQSSVDRLSSAALNSPAGRMMSGFFEMLPSGEAAKKAFQDPTFALMRDAILQADGEAGRQGLYRLLLQLRFLDYADSAWTEATLLEPLRREGGVPPEQWDAISRIGLLRADALSFIAIEMARRVSDERLPEDVRSRLAERLVLPVAIELREGRPPPMSLPEIEQMLRLGGDQVRAAAAHALVRLVEDSEDSAGTYRLGVAPILANGWPKDRAARSSAVSDALAPLPAAAGPALPEAVTAIADLLVPFDVWSLWEYRLYKEREVGGARELRAPCDLAQAKAVLTLLDRTIGDEEGSVVPRDLDLALTTIVEHWKGAPKDRAFGRLTALARR